MEPSLKSIGRNSKKKGGAILSAELRHSWGAVYGHPSCASWGFIMLFKIVDCTARWGIGKELQSHCKPRGNPRADDWMFFFVLLASCYHVAQLLQLHRALCHHLHGADTLLCLFLFFVLPENPTALSALPSLWQLSFATPVRSHLCAFRQHSEASQSQSSKEIPEKKGYPGLCICRLKPSF